jgi:hypothetical protein
VTPTDSPTPQFTAEERAGLLTSVGGSHARRLSPVEVGTLLRREHDRGVPTRALAEALHLAPGTSVLTWFLRLPDLPAEVQSLVEFGRPKAGLNLTQAAEIARLSGDRSAMQRLAVLAVEEQLTGSETRSVVQIVQRRGVPVDDAVRETVGGRPQIERLHVILGQLSAVAVQNLPGSHEERARKLEAALHTAGVEATSIRASGERFTAVMSDAQVAQMRALNIDVDELERRLNNALTTGAS